MISNLAENSEVQVIGLIDEVKITMTKKKEKMHEARRQAMKDHVNISN